MDNQHKLIKGYRDLSQTEIDRINLTKELGEKLNDIIEASLDESAGDQKTARSINIAKTHLQTGLMWLIRGIAKPEGF